MTTVVWEVPFGRDRRWGGDANAALNALLGGWRVTAINTMTSGAAGQPDLLAGGAFQVSGVPTYRPNVTGDIYAAEPAGITNWFNPANIVVPTDSSQPFGNAARNAARGPALYTLDLGLHKASALGGSSRIEFRVEAFNVLNRTQLRRAERQPLVDANFGTITSLATTPRQVQLGVKFDF